MKGLVTLIVVLLLAGTGLYFFSPWFKTKVDDTVAGMKEWDAEARRKNPVGYIDYASKRLEATVEKFENVRSDLAVATATLKDMKTKTSQKVVVADTTLEALKAAYKEAKGGKGWPVKVAEGSYTEATLKSQVNSLLKEKEAFTKVAAQADAGLVKAERSALEIQNRITESKGQITILATQKQLVKMNQLTVDSEKLLAEVNVVLLQNEAAAQRPAVRTVDELMRDTDASTGAASPDVDAFLNG